MNRRGFLATLGCLGFGAPPAVFAQSPTKIPSIGWLGANSEAAARHLHQSFLQGLREIGYKEGQNILIERRWAEGQIERLPALADELVKLKVDVIVAPTTPAALAAPRATNSIPIVFVVASDPVGTGLVASLPRPGGNITGYSTINVELGPKRLELLKDIVPGVRRVAMLYNPLDSANVLVLQDTQRAAKTLNVTLVGYGVQTLEAIGEAFASIARDRIDALLLPDAPVLFNNTRSILDHVARLRLPTMCGFREGTELGALVAFTVNWIEQFRCAAKYVDRILRGATPAELPVEQPTKFGLIVNLKAAKALGIKIPQSILLRASDVIQ